MDSDPESEPGEAGRLSKEEVNEMIAFLEKQILEGSELDGADDEWIDIPNPDPLFRNEEKVMGSMGQIRRWEFYRRQAALKSKTPVSYGKCAMGTCLSKRDRKVVNPGPWLKCPFGHCPGDEYRVNPIPPKPKNTRRPRLFLRTLKSRQ
jgi:hypothetical protein